MAASDHYATLGVPRDADAATIRRAYRRAAAANHPDRAANEQDRQQREARMQSINAANDVLGDPERRRRYDAGEGDAPAGPTPEEQLRIDAMRQLALLFEKNMMDANPLQSVRDDIASAKHNAGQDIASLKKRVAILNARRDKVSTKNGAENLYLAVLQKKLDEHNGQIEDLQRMLRTAKEVEKILADYEADAPPAPQAPAFDSRNVFQKDDWGVFLRRHGGGFHSGGL